jgi:hypothetical protein
MTNDDQTEMIRLSEMLQEIDRQLESASPMREALTKAEIALSHAFNDGWRPKIEHEHAWIQNLRKRSN